MSIDEISFNQVSDIHMHERFLFKSFRKPNKVLRETSNICVYYRKHIWLAYGIKIVDIIFIALLFVKKRKVSIRVSILHKRVVAVIIVVNHCR